MSEWLPIESAPKDGTRILLFWPRYSFDTEQDIGRLEPRPVLEVGWWKRNDRLLHSSAAEFVERYKLSAEYFSTSWEYDDYGEAMIDHGPTHWQPLPDPPTPAKQDTQA